MTILGSPNRPV